MTVEACPDGPLPPAATPTAYIISTSGSTSAPKDVPVSDANLRAYGDHLTGHWPLRAQERIAQNYQPGFDPFYTVLLLSWLFDGALVYPVRREHLLVDRYVQDNRITVWDSVHSQARMARTLGYLRPGAMPTMRLATFGGEALDSDPVRAWRAAAPAEPAPAT